MRMKHRSIVANGPGSVSLICEENEDMWNLYNLILVGDRIRANTVRRIVKETATGSKDSKERKRVTLTIQIDKVDFDPQDCILRLSGRNVEENKWVKMGAHHTIVLELQKQFTLMKDLWDPVAVTRLEDSCDVTKHADIAALMIDLGLANICLLTQLMTITRARISTPLPRKRKQGMSSRNKAIDRFFGQVFEAIIRHVNFDVVKCLIIAGPGFVKNQFYDYMMLEAVRQDNRALIENKGKILVTHASSAHKHSLKEVLADPQVLDRVKDTKASLEIKSLNDFYHMLTDEPDRATYGLKQVLKASASQAIETLLISDGLFRSNDIRTRRQYVQLVEDVKENGGDVRIFSSLHVSGTQLEKLTGVAAILRFPMTNLESDSEESESESESEDEGEGKGGSENKNGSENQSKGESESETDGEHEADEVHKEKSTTEEEE